METWVYTEQMVKLAQATPVAWSDILLVHATDGFSDDVGRAARVLIFRLVYLEMDEATARRKVLGYVGERLATDEAVRTLWKTAPSIDEVNLRLAAAQRVYDRATAIKNAKGD